MSANLPGIIKDIQSYPEGAQSGLDSVDAGKTVASTPTTGSKSTDTLASGNDSGTKPGSVGGQDKAAAPTLTTGSKTTDTLASGNDSGLGAKSGSDDKAVASTTTESMTWQYLHTVRAGMYGVNACHMISHNQLAVCTYGCVQVYTVSANNSTLAYTVYSWEWLGKRIHGVAVSECMPDSMLVICNDIPYVYQYPCYESNKKINKYAIQGNNKSPWCISANASVAVIKMEGDKSFIVCGLPQFTQQSSVQIDFSPYHMSMTSDYLLVVGLDVMVVRALSDVWQDVWRVERPDGWEFQAVSFRNNGTEIYTACLDQGYSKGCVYKYTWNGVGKPEYINSGCIIDGLGFVGSGNLSVTSDGFLAVGQGRKVRIYKLQ
ncbi:uncharacterized protein [Amphiura filiformis]|uniref:uncharacterized protein n=1 Tax=Amphiura filiformis TaxID=82378 RepID=UPI003B2152A1